MKRKSTSTFERLMKDQKRRKHFDEKYSEFLLSEIILDLMTQEKITVRALAKKVGVSPTLIQDIKSGKRTNVTFRSLLGITASLGARLKVEKGSGSYYLVD